MLRISHQNTFFFLRYAHVKYVTKIVYKHLETIENVNPKTAGGGGEVNLIPLPHPVVFRKTYLLKRG